MELANERQRLQNNLAVQAYINNDKNMELLMKRYNLSEAEFKERVRQFNVNAARADKSYLLIWKLLNVRCKIGTHNTIKV